MLITGGLDFSLNFAEDKHIKNELSSNCSFY